MHFVFSVILDIFNRGSSVFVFFMRVSARTTKERRCGVSPPHDEVLLFRQKDPKPLAPGRGPRGVPFAPVPVAVGCGTPLRSGQSLAPNIEFAGPGRSHARRRRGNGAMGWRGYAAFVMPDILHRASSVLVVFVFIAQGKTKDFAGFRPRASRFLRPFDKTQGSGQGICLSFLRSSQESSVFILYRRKERQGALDSMDRLDPPIKIRMDIASGMTEGAGSSL